MTALENGVVPRTSSYVTFTDIPSLTVWREIDKYNIPGVVTMFVRLEPIRDILNEVESPAREDYSVLA